LNEKEAETCAAVLSAMANPVRMKILMCLVEGEIPVTVLASRIGASQSAVSQHLAKLRRQQLVTSRRHAQTIYYSSQSPAVLALLQTLDEVKFERVN